MGYVQGRPKIESGGGEIVLQYLNGEPCHVGRENESGRSTTIHFRCSGYEQGPKFFYETAYCDYIFTWDTPSACATNVSALSLGDISTISCARMLITATFEFTAV